jgi:carbon storage regulator
MLVLTRKPGQKIIIANNIEVVILDIKGDTVKIGVQAPKQISIYREEIYQEICKANVLATQHFTRDNLDNVVRLMGSQPATSCADTSRTDTQPE